MQRMPKALKIKYLQSSSTQGSAYPGPTDLALATMEVLVSRPEEALPELIKVHVKFLKGFKGCHDIHWHLVKNRSDQLLAAPQVEHLPLPSHHLCRCPIQDLL
jgi:hypothetical protein